MMDQMTSSKPYMVRALYEWILDNELTPHLLVNALHQGVQVPLDYVKDGQITFNVAPSAVKALSMSNDAVLFSARFRGIPYDVQIPIYAVMGIYARENGKGMMFQEDTDSPPEPPNPPVFSSDKPMESRPNANLKPNRNKGERPNLRVVK